MISIQVAHRARDYRLAVLLAQAIGPVSERDLLVQQLVEWREHEYVGGQRNLISKDRWKVCACMD
jgi:hypothetical protein